MFRYCCQFKLKMNLQTDTTLNGNFDGNENTNTKVRHTTLNCIEVLKYLGFIKAELIRR